MTNTTTEKIFKQQKDKQHYSTNTTSKLQTYLQLIGQYLNLAQLSNYK